MVLPIVIGLLVIAAFVALAFMIRRGAGAARHRIDSALAELDVQRQGKANFYGVASKGSTQVRGLGTLALTPDELVFLQLVPANEVRVPRPAIQTVEVARSFLGKTQGRELLVISWAADGVDEQVAFDVPDLDAWRQDLATD